MYKGIFLKILEIWNKEKSMKELSYISPEVEESIYQYINYIKKQLKVSDKKALSTILKYTEYEILQKIIYEIFEIRLRKIVFSTLEDSYAENLLDFEKPLIQNLTKIFEEYREKVRNLSFKPKTLLFPKEKNRFLTVFLQPFPKIIGEDMKSYGPFKTYDITSIPIGNIKGLVRKKIVKYIPIF
jgi:DNA replication factor GINS